MTEGKIYDRQPTDTPKSWDAFCCYRDMGVHRSLDKAFRLWKKLPQDDPKTAPKYFCKWSSDFEWVKRVEEYDADTQKRLRDEQIEKDRAAYQKQVHELQTESMAIAKDAHAVARGIIGLCAGVTNRLMEEAKKPNATLTREQIGLVVMASTALKNAISAGDSASKLRGDSLYINDIIDRLKKYDEDEKAASKLGGDG